MNDFGVLSLSSLSRVGVMLMSEVGDVSFLFFGIFWF